MANIIQQPNKFELALQKTIFWISGNKDRFWSIVGAILIGSIITAFSLQHRRQQNDDAWTQLGALQGQAQNDAAAALKGMDAWMTRFQGTRPSSYALFLKADLLYKTSDYATAAKTYASLSQTAPVAEMRPLALFAQESAEEMAGRIPEARQLAKIFTDTYPDHFLAASAYLNQARLAEKMGDTVSATAVYVRFTILYPQSPWTAMARARQQALRGAPAPASQSTGTHQ